MVSTEPVAGQGVDDCDKAASLVAGATPRRSASSLGAPMSEDGGFDYRTLSRAQIEYALNHIDGSRFPRNLKNARTALEERISGVSPEPAPILDKATNAKYTFWMERLLGVILTAYAAFGLAFNDLPVPVISHISG